MEVSLFARYQQPLCKSKETERGELMKELMDNLNISRVQGKYKPLTMPRMCKLLEKIPTDALYALVSKCKDAGERAGKRTPPEKYHDCYSKRFYFEIRPQV